MTVRIFGIEAKDQICLAYAHKTMNLRELAYHYNTSTRTIGRVLEERGLATPVPRLKGEAYQAMKVLKEFDLTPTELWAHLSAPKTPAFTPENVQTYLNMCSKEELARFFYTSGLVKLAAIAKHVQANVQAQQQQPVSLSH